MSAIPSHMASRQDCDNILACTYTLAFHFLNILIAETSCVCVYDKIATINVLITETSCVGASSRNKSSISSSDSIFAFAVTALRLGAFLAGGSSSRNKSSSDSESSTAFFLVAYNIMYEDPWTSELVLLLYAY